MESQKNPVSGEKIQQLNEIMNNFDINDIQENTVKEYKYGYGEDSLFIGDYFKEWSRFDFKYQFLGEYITCTYRVYKQGSMCPRARLQSSDTAFYILDYSYGDYSRSMPNCDITLEHHDYIIKLLQGMSRVGV